MIGRTGSFTLRTDNARSQHQADRQDRAGEPGYDAERAEDGALTHGTSAVGDATALPTALSFAGSNAELWAHAHWPVDAASIAGDPSPLSIQRAGDIPLALALSGQFSFHRTGASVESATALPSLPSGLTVSADQQTVVILDTGVSTPIDHLIYQYDFYGHDSNATTSATHGSIVASQVLAADSTANIVMLKVASDSSGTISLSAVDTALDWVAKYAQQLNVAAVNLSFGASTVVSRETSTTLSDEFATLRALDVAVVVAAGNSSARAGVSALSSDANAICVSASDGNEHFASFSNRDADLTDLVADGVDIAYGRSVVSGTSFSAPLVAGAIAAVKDVFQATYGRELSVNEAMDLLQATGDPMSLSGEIRSTSSDAGAGYVQLDLVGALNTLLDTAALAALGISV